MLCHSPSQSLISRRVSTDQRSLALLSNSRTSAQQRHSSRRTTAGRMLARHTHHVAPMSIDSSADHSSGFHGVRKTIPSEHAIGVALATPGRSNMAETAEDEPLMVSNAAGGEQSSLFHATRCMHMRSYQCENVSQVVSSACGAVLSLCRWTEAGHTSQLRDESTVIHPMHGPPVPFTSNSSSVCFVGVWCQLAQLVQQQCCAICT
jgi:hypothetical protein